MIDQYFIYCSPLLKEPLTISYTKTNDEYDREIVCIIAWFFLSNLNVFNSNVSKSNSS